MRLRRLVAAVVLLVWIATLAWHVRREYLPSAGARLAEAALTLPPGVAYYALFRGEAVAGWGQVQLDTLPAGTGFVVRERWQIELPGLGEAGRSERRGEVRLDARLRPRRFTYLTVSSRGSTTVEGEVEGDSVLAVHVRHPGGGEALRFPTGAGLLLPAAWPLRLAALGAARPGSRYDLRLFDPAVADTRRAEIRILERTTRTFADSADLDSLSGQWFAAREDTVMAWHVERGTEGSTVTEWVDEDGRLIEGQLPGGVRLVRTAFELAFYLRPGATAAAGEIDASRDTAASGRPGGP